MILKTKTDIKKGFCKIFSKFMTAPIHLRQKYKYIFKFYFKYFITLFIFYQLKIITPFPKRERGYYKNGLIYKIEASFTSSISFFSA